MERTWAGRTGERRSCVAARSVSSTPRSRSPTSAAGNGTWPPASVTWSDELYRIYGLAPRSCAITLEEFLARVHPDDRERVQRQVAAAVERGGPFGHGERIVRPDGSVRKLDTVGEVLVDAHGRPVSLIGTCRDITDDPREFARLVQAGEQRALEMLATGAPLPDVLAELVRLVEEMAPESIASILLMDDTGTRIQHGTAPSLPDAYNQAIHGVIIGPQAGSCGTAAFRRKPVFVTDIETDPLWEPYRDLARSYGLRACWSFPILATDGHVLGTVGGVLPAAADGRPAGGRARLARGPCGGHRHRAPQDRRTDAGAVRKDRDDPRGRAHQHRARAPRPAGPVAHGAEVGDLLAGPAAGR